MEFNNVQLAAFIAIVMALIEIIKMLISKMARKTNSSVLTHKEHEWLHDLHSMHNKTDQDGLPLWYVPRVWTNLFKDVNESLRSINGSNVLQLKCLEEVEDKLTKAFDGIKELRMKLNNMGLHRNER